MLPQGRGEALRALCEWKTPGVEQLLAEALRDKNSELRANAVLLCSQGWYAACVPILLKMGTDPDPLVRRYLGAALGVGGDPDAVPVLLKLLNDTTDPQIAIWAAHGLGKWKRPDEAVPAMIRLLNNPKARGDRGNIIATLQELTGEKFETRKAWLEWWKKSAPK
jgi:HEAT repeat protein